jgi:hypothetical protein
LFRFRYYSSHCIHRGRVRTYQHTAFAALDRYDIFYGTHKTDAGIDFETDRMSLLHNVVKRVPNRTEQFHSVFGSTHGYEVSKNWVSLS